VGVGPPPNYNNIEALNQQYYSQGLQILFESLELCLKEGLELKDPFDIEFDLEGLLRMDSVQKMDVATKGVVGGVLAPNEARAGFNRRPVPGGDTVYLQRQNWPLEKLGSDDPSLMAAPSPVPVPAKQLTEDEIVESALDLSRKALAA